MNDKTLKIIQDHMIGRKFAGDTITNVVYLREGWFGITSIRRFREVEELYIMENLGLKRIIVKERIKEWLNS